MRRVLEGDGWPSYCRRLFQNTWSYTSSPPDVFLAIAINQARDSFVSPLSQHTKRLLQNSALLTHVRLVWRWQNTPLLLQWYPRKYYPTWSGLTCAVGLRFTRVWYWIWKIRFCTGWTVANSFWTYTRTHEQNGDDDDDDDGYCNSLQFFILTCYLNCRS